MAKRFCQILTSDNNPWGKLDIKREFMYSSGRADVIGVNQDGKVIAFELKLEKWNEALNQAYRNTSYANCSYVVVPEKTALKAQQKLMLFSRRSVGLCYLRGKSIIIIFPAKYQEPIQPWLTNLAKNMGHEKGIGKRRI